MHKTKEMLKIMIAGTNVTNGIANILCMYQVIIYKNVAYDLRGSDLFPLQEMRCVVWFILNILCQFLIETNTFALLK